MDIFLAIIAFIIVAFVWFHAGMNGRNDSGTENLWKPARVNQKSVSPGQRRVNREYALQKAKPFLKKYKDAMGEHCLANENCKVNLIIEEENKKIVCISKKPTNKDKIKILTATIAPEMTNLYSYTVDYVIDNLWDTLCMNFTAITAYENIHDAVSVALLAIQESEINLPQGTKTQKVYDSVSNTQIRTNNLLNINTATEAELLALPGVNIVIAKKALKYIERTGGFNSVEEFIEKMKIKNIFVEQIKNLTCVALEDNSENNKTNEENMEEENNVDNVEETQSTYIPHTDNGRIIDL